MQTATHTKQIAIQCGTRKVLKFSRQVIELIPQLRVKCAKGVLKSGAGGPTRHIVTGTRMPFSVCSPLRATILSGNLNSKDLQQILPDYLYGNVTVQVPGHVRSCDMRLYACFQIDASAGLAIMSRPCISCIRGAPEPARFFTHKL